ncbi:unnamed protein product [Calypogeia fissa]
MYEFEEDQQVLMDHQRYFSFTRREDTLERHFSLEPDLGTSSSSYESVVSSSEEHVQSPVSQVKSLHQRQQLALDFVEQSSVSQEDNISEIATLAAIHADLKLETSVLSSWVAELGAQFSMGDFDDPSRISLSTDNGLVGRTRTRESNGRLSFVTAPAEDEQELSMSSFLRFSTRNEASSHQQPLKGLGHTVVNSSPPHYQQQQQQHQYHEVHQLELIQQQQQFQIPGQFSTFDDSTVTMSLPSFGSSPGDQSEESSVILDQWDRGMSPPREKRQKLMSPSAGQHTHSMIHHPPLKSSIKDSLQPSTRGAPLDDSGSVESTMTNVTYHQGGVVQSRLAATGGGVIDVQAMTKTVSQFNPPPLPPNARPPLIHLQQQQLLQSSFPLEVVTRKELPAPSKIGTSVNPTQSVQSPRFEDKVRIPPNGASAGDGRLSAMSLRGLEDGWPSSLGLSLKGLNSLGASHAANTMEHLLVMCAQALEKQDVNSAHQIMFLLNNMVSSEGDPNQGDPNQRVTSCFLKALVRRAGRMVPSFNAMYGVERESKAVSAVEYAVMVDITPWFRFGFKAANGAMLEAFEGKDRVHIIDFTTTYGMQWPTMIEALSARAEGPPQVRLTVCKARPDVAPYLGMSQEDVITRLRLFAATKNVDLDVTVIPHEIDLLNCSMFDIRDDEFTAINCMYRARFIPDESADPAGGSGQCCPRDNFFTMVHSLNPSLVTMVDEEVNVTSPSLVTRLKAAFNYLWIPFDSLDTFLPRDSPQRLEYELVLAKKIENIIVCEGLERIERMETKERWGQRMRKARFELVPFSEDVSEEVKIMLSDHAAGWGMKQDEDAMLLTWKGHNVLFATAWRPSSSPSMTG